MAIWRALSFKTVIRIVISTCFFAGLLVCEGFAFEKNMPLSDMSTSYLGAANFGYTGWSISTGDVDGDGVTDFLIGGDEVYIILGKNIDNGVGDDIEDFADASFIGESGTRDDFGYAVSMSGDVNNDGFDDILIGAKGRDRTYLILGNAGGWALDTPVLDAAAATFESENEDDLSGCAVTFAGDVNNDGFDDILIGAYLADNGESVNNGRTYLILGEASGWTGSISLSQADVIYIGENEGEGSGRKLAAAGDVNGDGYEDFLVFAPSGGGRLGEIYLILGQASGWTGEKSLSSADASFYGESSYSASSAASAGDVNGDGYDDILIGCDSSYNKAYIIFGKDSGWSLNTSLSSADVSYVGEDTADQLGRAVSSAGDVNNDGFDDVLISTVRANQYAGKVYLVYGKESGWSTNVDIAEADASFIGEAAYDYGGFTMAPAGDRNNDGNDEFLISSAYFGSYYTGKVYLVTQEEDDTDGDGLSDSVENSSCTNPLDADSDDDGIMDGVEDANHNGVVDSGETNPCLADTDGDGLQDGTELGYTSGHADTGGGFIPDLDPSDTTNPLLADSDSDGFLDGEEDTDRNGRVDAWEADPASDTSYPTVVVNLYPGYNLCAIPADVSAQSGLADWLPVLGNSTMIESIRVLESGAGQFVTLSPDDTSNPEVTLLGGEGLVVVSLEERRIGFAAVACADYEIVEGVNLAGIPCPADEENSAFLFLEENQDHGIVSIQRYSSEKGAFESAGFAPTGEISGVDFPIVPGEGYFIYKE